MPFFNIVAFVIGTYINSHTKKKRLAALRRKHYGDGRDDRGSTTVGGSVYKEYKDDQYRPSGSTRGPY